MIRLIFLSIMIWPLAAAAGAGLLVALAVMADWFVVMERRPAHQRRISLPMYRHYKASRWSQWS